MNTALVHAAPGTSALRQTTAHVRDAYRTYDPPNMLCVGAELKELGRGIGGLVHALGYLQRQSHDKDPVTPRMTMEIEKIWVKVGTIATFCEPMFDNFMNVHREDLKRYSQPRKGTLNERRWNIGTKITTDGATLEHTPSVFAGYMIHVATVYGMRYRPEHMMQVYTEYLHMPDAIRDVAHALELLRDRANGLYPLDKSVADDLNKIVHDLNAAASESSMLMRVFRNDHAHKIAKHENPRNGEPMWNV